MIGLDGRRRKKHIDISINKNKIEVVMLEKIITVCAGLKRWQIEEKLWTLYYGRSSKRMKKAALKFAEDNGLMLVEPLSE